MGHSLQAHNNNPDKRASAQIIGGGLAGLSAAYRLSKAGVPVTLYEASAHLGGRCRSYEDEVLGRVIDNGNHLIVDANDRMVQLIKDLHSTEHFHHAEDSSLLFADLERNRQWRYALGGKTLPPGFRFADLLRVIRLFTCGRDTLVSQIWPMDSALMRNLIEPLCLATLNTHPDKASADMLRDVVMALLKPGAARYWQIKTDFTSALVKPVIKAIEKAGGKILLNHRLESFGYDKDRINLLSFANGFNQGLRRAGDRVIFALPAWEVRTLLNTPLPVPEKYNGILNGHFLYSTEHIPQEKRLVGVIGSPLQWIFVKDGLISTTTSDVSSTTLAEKDNTEAAHILWNDACTALGLGKTALPPHRIIREKRATFAATPENQGRRPNHDTPYYNAVMAGDWLNTGLPATLEGAVRSGENASDITLKRLGRT
jgi:hydroxysqualene dehydroxylase